jgi:hypothetical protein
MFQLKESSRYKKIEEESVEEKTSGIGYGRKTSSRRVKIKRALRVI